jgi:hypothetical protein
MSLQQMSLTTGRQMPTDRLTKLRAQADNLPGLYRLANDKAYKDKVFAQNQSQNNAINAHNQEQMALARDVAKTNAKNMKIGNAIKFGSTLVSAAPALMGMFADDAEPVAEAATTGVESMTDGLEAFYTDTSSSIPDAMSFGDSVEEGGLGDWVGDIGDVATKLFDPSFYTSAVDSVVEGISGLWS